MAFVPAISSILLQAQQNFGNFFTPTAQVPSVNFLFGPEWQTLQSGPAQIVAFPGKEPGIGPDLHFNQPGQPRNLRQLWTRIYWLIWAPWPPLPFWVAAEPVVPGQLTIPSVNNQNGFYYTASNTGVTGSLEPAPWPTTIGATIVDNGITWTCTDTTADYTVHKTDNVEYIRAALVQGIHYMSVGSYKIIGGEWYTKTDQLVMDGTLYCLTTEFKVPLIDVTEGVATVIQIPVSSEIE